MRRHAWLVVAACGAACGSNSKVVDDHGAPAVVPDAAVAVALDAASMAAEPTFAGTPDTLAGHALAWMLDGMITRKGDFTEADVTARLAPSFLAAVPAADFIKLSKQIGSDLEGATVAKVDGDATHVVAHVTAPHGKLVFLVQVDASTKLIVSAAVRPDEELGPKPTSWGEVETQLGEYAPHSQLLVAAIDAKGTCKPLHEYNSKAEQAIGSAFKLYVLLGLADKIAAGKLTWDQTLAVRDDWKSLPSGITQNDPAGTALSIETLATRMISISDNTATDHLLYTVGRTAVEAELKAARHSKAALDVPFMGTREMFVLKLIATPEENAAYLKMTATKRRAYLDQTLAGKTVPLDNIAAWTSARQIDKLEWYASPVDMCNAMGQLYVRGQKLATAKVMDVLSKNSIIGVDKVKFPYVGAKGGSEPGVLSLQFLLERADGKWFMVSTAFNADEGGVVEEGKVIGFAQGVLDLVAVEP